MLAIAVTAGLFTVALSSLWILLLVLPPLPFLVHRRAPSTEFLCALMGTVIGALYMVPIVNFRLTNDFRDFIDLFWIIGGTGAGALVGAIVAWADRRTVRGRRGSS
jgi:hypothetical protein